MIYPEFFKDYRAFVSFQKECYGKSTLFESEHILVPAGQPHRIVNTEGERLTMLVGIAPSQAD